MTAARQLELASATPFDIWDACNPHVYRLFERFAFEAIRAGRQRIGAKLIVERMRWHTSVETTGSAFKIDNTFTTGLARKFAARHPGHANLFAFRGAED